MIDDRKPVIFETPTEFSEIEVYILHDLHMGNYLFNGKKWQAVKDEILEKPNRYCIIVGDCMENAVPGSKSDMFSQLYTPEDQKEWVSDQFKQLADRIICVVDGNHERNRSTKLCGLYPLYDACVYAGVQTRYRPHFAFADIAVGTRTKGGPNKNSKNQVRYVGFVVHRAKDMKNYSSSDSFEGIDFMVYGHDHDPHDHPRAKLHYDRQHQRVYLRSVETVDGGSFLDYGGYAADGGYRPQSDKLYKMVLSGGSPRIKTVGFYI